VPLGQDVTSYTWSLFKTVQTNQMVNKVAILSKSSTPYLRSLVKM